MSDPKCTAADAVGRAGRLVSSRTGQYVLGTGDYRPTTTSDTPWTVNAGLTGSDCAGFAICWAWKLVRHRPGFNKGPWASVEDDINCNSAIEDAQHRQELFTEISTALAVRPGDLLAYPTFYLTGFPRPFIGHVGLVMEVPHDYTGHFGQLVIAQCHGPNGFSPGAVITDGFIWQHHDELWPKPEHRTHIIRPKERV